MIKKITIRILIVCFTIFLACKSENSIENEAFDLLNYHRYFVNNIVTPAADAFFLDVKNLQEAVTNFDLNTDEENVLLLRNLWKNTAISFSKTEMTNLGDIETSAVFVAIYSWGANEAKIEEFIASTENIEQSVINSLPTKSRGLSAIEYLLFDADLTATVARFSDQRRIDFLLALCENLLIKSSFLDEQWKNYRTSFINNSTTSINGSINLIVNQINVLLENIVRFKIGEAAGLENSANVNSLLLQAYKSEISLQIIKENIATVKAVYYGNMEGLDDYISTITTTEDINIAITTAFSSAENNIASLSNTTLKYAIENNNSIVNELHQNIKDLIILLKVDVASALSITVTFTDNDGD